MNMDIGWDKIRVLITNGCNYRCPFCHNEGQEKSKITFMLVDDFIRVVDFLSEAQISEFVISGGEPFLHPQITDMILYACNKLRCDISCATNLSLLSESALAKLANTRVKFNIQYPFTDSIKFKESTGNGDLSTILSNIKKVREAGLEIGLNSVIQSSNAKMVEDMVLYAISNHLPLKLLPQIGGEKSVEYKDWVFPIIRKYATSEKDKGTGAIRWEVSSGDKNTSILYIDSPCFTRDISTCRNFAELRILPRMLLQSCIERHPSNQLDFSKGKSFVSTQFLQEWNNFKSC